MPDYTAPICPLPGLGVCVRERCNFWDDKAQECTSDCCTTETSLDPTASPDPSPSCLISCYEDYD